jgi:hypothetical protein
MNLGYNSIFLPGFVGKAFWETVKLRPVPVHWFTPGPRPTEKDNVFEEKKEYKSLNFHW